MDEKAIKKRPAKKMPVKESASPFESLAEAVPAAPVSPTEKKGKKPTVKKAAAPKIKAAREKKPTAKRVERTEKPAVVEPVTSKASPFSAVAAEGSAIPEPKPTAAKAVRSGPRKPKKPAAAGIAGETEAPKAKTELSTAAKLLAEPELPQLERENRARLMMQTPTELYFYWSVRENPYHILKKAFGTDIGSYTLALKLTNLNTGDEEIYPVEAEGNWWFHVEPNGKYEAEIGFYAPNRPYFRIIYSNTVETPRRGPSPKPATDAVWTVSANKFAEVLDVAGFTADAVDVAMAGDDHEVAEAATHTAFARFTGTNGNGTKGIAGEDIRYALRALASGMQVDELRGTVGSRLFAILKERSADVPAEKAADALASYFDVPESEYMEETTGAAVFGASLVHFPRGRRPRRPEGRLGPVSSHSLSSPVGG